MSVADPIELQRYRSDMEPVSFDRMGIRKKKITMIDYKTISDALFGFDNAY